MENAKSMGTEHHIMQTMMDSISELWDMTQSNNIPSTLLTNSSDWKDFDGSIWTLEHLQRNEIELLKSQNNKCDDWSTIFKLIPRTDNVNDKYNYQSIVEVPQSITNTNFSGTIIFILPQPDNVVTQDINDVYEWKQLPTGIHDNLIISNSILDIVSCRVYRNVQIYNSYIASNTCILNCTLLSSLPSPSGEQQQLLQQHNDSMTITVGPESGGGRDLLVESNMTMIDICNQLCHPKSIKSNKNNKSNSRTKKSCIITNFILSYSTIRDTSTIQNVVLHPHASIHNANMIQNVVMYPNSTILNSCNVTNVYMQWNASITNNSTVSDTLLMEHAHSGPHSLVASTVLGPDVHVSAGEVHASIIGPNTNAHHQSLVIGVLWPLGRGNIGYGANVGSNHTGRIPDQELTSGEGIFWGLSCVIKFPIDLSLSPYSIVAAGTTLSPQRICMPFALLVQQQQSNNVDILPGWVLQSSLYTLVRSEEKYATRRKAKHHDFYTGWKILRPDIIQMCVWARNQLLQHHHHQRDQQQEQQQKLFGIGSCNLSPRACQTGIRAYTEIIHRFALHGLFDIILQRSNNNNNNENNSNNNNFNQVLLSIHNELLDMNNESKSSSVLMTLMNNPSKQVAWPKFPWESSSSSSSLSGAATLWKYQKELLHQEFNLTKMGIQDLLLKFVELEHGFAKRVMKSKKRDDIRGAETIPGYADSHVAAEHDKVVTNAFAKAEQVETTVKVILENLPPLIKSRL